MKIAIIGCGYVGSAAAAFWKQKGHAVTVTTTTPSRVEYLKQQYGRALLLIGHHSGNWNALLDDNEAVLLSVAPARATDYENTYLRTAQTLANLLEKNHTVSQVLYTGSTSVYGSHEGKWVDETSELLAESHQSRILIETEKTLLQTSNPPRKVAIFRLAEIYGPGREVHERLKRIQGLSAAGDGSNYTNLIHVDDIVRALDYAITNKMEGIYNLCNDAHLPRREFYDRLCEAHHLQKISWDPAKISIHGGNRRVSNQKIKQAGFTFCHD
jgi:nucleoside-diphosphate-sugar epimerase